jgi:hypothetical protein
MKKNMNIVYIDEMWIDTSYTAKYCWQSKGERGALLPISRGQCLIVVHSGGCAGFVPGYVLLTRFECSLYEYLNLDIFLIYKNGMTHCP